MIFSVSVCECLPIYEHKFCPNKYIFVFSSNVSKYVLGVLSRSRIAGSTCKCIYGFVEWNRICFHILFVIPISNAWDNIIFHSLPHNLSLCHEFLKIFIIYYMKHFILRWCSFILHFSYYVWNWVKDCVNSVHMIYFFSAIFLQPLNNYFIC